ncbi:MAG: DNA polymerase III subunit delta [Bacillota bacterium]|jgi:DNA polymerase-3 subunit delta
MRQFFNSIKQGVLSPVYLFYGEQDLLKDEAIEALIKLVAPDGNSWNIEVFDGAKTSVEELCNAASTAPFFSSRRLIIVKDAPWFAVKSSQKYQEGEHKEDALSALLQYLENPVVGNILVFTVRGDIDKRRKLVKSIQKAGRVIEFASLSQNELMIWLGRRFAKNGKRVTADAIDYLSILGGNNLSHLANEVDKISLYCADKEQVELKDVEAVASKGSLLQIFKLIDAVAEKKADLSLYLYQEMLNQGEAEQKILSMLGKHFRDILAVDELRKQGFSSTQIAGQLSIHPFVARKCAEKSQKFTRDQLIEALELLLAADIANKSGQGDLNAMLQMAIIRICA